MRKVQIGRRELLFGLGASLVAAPFINLLEERAAKAGDPATGPNLVVIFTPNGTIPQRWKPTGQGSSYDFAPGSILEPSPRTRPICSSAAGSTSSASATTPPG